MDIDKAARKRAIQKIMNLELLLAKTFTLIKTLQKEEECKKGQDALLEHYTEVYSLITLISYLDSNKFDGSLSDIVSGYNTYYKTKYKRLKLKYY